MTPRRVPRGWRVLERGAAGREPDKATAQALERRAGRAPTLRTPSDTQEHPQRSPAAPRRLRTTSSPLRRRAPHRAALRALRGGDSVAPREDLHDRYRSSHSPAQLWHRGQAPDRPRGFSAARRAAARLRAYPRPTGSIEQGGQGSAGPSAARLALEARRATRYIPGQQPRAQRALPKPFDRRAARQGVPQRSCHAPHPHKRAGCNFTTRPHRNPGVVRPRSIPHSPEHGHSV